MAEISPIISGVTPAIGFTLGDTLVATATSITRIAGVATGNVPLSGGVGVAWSWGKVTSGHVDSSIYSTGNPQVNITGNAGTVTIANNASDSTCYPVFARDPTGSQNLYTHAVGLEYDSSSATLTAWYFSGDLIGNASTATILATTRAIYGNNFDGSAALTQIIASTYGGTGNGFTKFTGPTTAEKTFTLPNSSETLLYSGGPLGTPSSGTLTSCTFPTLNQNTTGSAASLSISGQTGLMTVTGLASTNRIKTVRDAADTILELGGSYTPTGTWTSMTHVTPVLGVASATSLLCATITGSAASGGDLTLISTSHATKGDIIVQSPLLFNTSTAFVASAAGTGTVYYNSSLGTTIHGNGSTYDVSLVNKSGGSVLHVPTGTVNMECYGELQQYSTSGATSIRMVNTSVAHGITGKALTNTIAWITPYGTTGGLYALGINTATGQSAFYFDGVHGTTGTPTVPVVHFIASKKNGTGAQAIDATSVAFAFDTGSTRLVTVLGSGNVGINETAPDYKLDVNGTFGFTPGTSVTPVDNGDVVFEFTNNTTLTIRAKGSDGTVRSGTVTLA